MLSKILLLLGVDILFTLFLARMMGLGNREMESRSPKKQSEARRCLDGSTTRREVDSIAGA